MKKIILILFLILLTNSFSAESFYPTSIAHLDSTVRLHGHGEISNLKEGEFVELTLLTFQETDFQKTKVITERLKIQDSIIFPEYLLDEFGNKYVKFKIPKNGSFEFELIADIQTQSIIHNLNDYSISNYKNQYPKNFEIYLTRSEKIESDSSEIKTLVNNKFLSDSFIETLNETIFWTNNYVEYASGADFQRYYLLQLSAINTLLEKKGVCDEFANLSAAILRQKGIPTRIAIGVVFDGLNWGNHAWIEVYHKDHGWIPSDPTFRESGFVDATHIKLGSFRDISLSVAKARYPEHAKVNFQTQTLPEVTIKNREYFSHVSINTQIKDLKANKWNEIKLNIKNLTQGVITAPIFIQQNYPQIIILNKNKSVILNANEEKEVIFNIYPKIDLAENQTAVGIITFNSLAPPFEKKITILPNQKTENGKLIINKITPIVTKDSFIFDISITNKFSEKQTINIDLNNSQTEYSWVEEINPFENKNIRKQINLVDSKHIITIQTKQTTYLQEFTPYQTKTPIVEKPTENIITQQINTETPVDATELLFSNPLIILIALLIGISIILLGVFAIRKKYI